MQVFNQYYSMFICLICLYVSMLYRIERQERDNGGDESIREVNLGNLEDWVK